MPERISGSFTAGFCKSSHPVLASAARRCNVASLFAEDEADVPGPVGKEAGAAAPAEITPRANPDLSGHEDVEKSLLQDYLGGRLPHALILAGPAGIGKATLAFRPARFFFFLGSGGPGEL